MALGNLAEFCNRLKRGPVFLFLGQHYLRLESGADAFLAEILRKYRGPSTGAESYSDLLDSRAADSPDSALAWMEERCRRLSIPDWLRVVASFAWSGVYSSAFDSIWPSAFRNAWREIQPVFEESYRPRDPRNRLLLHCTFLFGCVNRADVGFHPPLRRSDWRNQKQIAISLTRRLPELVTPLGTLVVEGHGFDRDWYELSDLLPVIGAMGPEQTHIFSAPGMLSSNPEVADLERAGKLILHTESLAQVLSRAAELGYIQLGLRPEEDRHGRRIRVRNRTLTVPRDLWNNVSRAASILDDSVLMPPPPLSEDALYREFREALARTDGRPDWSAHARGLLFARAYEANLHATVSRALAAKQLSDDPIILHGPTGTGKTVAAAALAYGIRRAGVHPVLFIERRTQRPNMADVEPFCRWAEDEELPEDEQPRTCLIVWDGMLELAEYSRSLRYLTSKGRKVVLVGTCYSIPSESAYAHGRRFVAAPQELSEQEVEDFARYLTRFHPALDQYVGRAPAILGRNFLVTLYRLLPPTRSIIRGGVAQEISRAETLIVQRASQRASQEPFPTALGKALLRAGIVSENEFLSATPTPIADEAFTGIQNLTGLIMVPGQFGIRVPVELLLRALGCGHGIWLPNLFRDLDIFHWYEDSVGNIEVGPRNRLEAQLIVQVRLGSPGAEIAFARRLLSQVRESQISGDPELDFAVELITAIRGGRQAASQYAECFKDMADTLAEIRETRGVENPRLMLQEANLLREWVICRARAGKGMPDDSTVLDCAEHVLQRALELIGDDPRRKDLRGFLLVELGTTLATKARSVIHHKAAPQTAMQCFESARKVLAGARALSHYNYYPIDVLAWSTDHMLQSGTLTEAQRAEAVADVLYAFQTAPKEDFDAEQRERYETRRLDFAQRIGHGGLADDAFRALIAAGSAAGYYLRALHISGLPDSAPDRGPWSHESLRRAQQYLEQNRLQLSHDSRCLDLLLDLYWMNASRSRFFTGERLTPPLTQEQWQYIVGLVDELLLIGESYRLLTLMFLRGLALFHLRQFAPAFDVFREIERGSESLWGKQRIIRSYLASTSSGAPQVFHGTITWVSSDAARGEVYAEEIMRRVKFFPREFGATTKRRGDTLDEFHIGFNFLGPVADPKVFLKR